MISLKEKYQQAPFTEESSGLRDVTQPLCGVDRVGSRFSHSGDYVPLNWNKKAQIGKREKIPKVEAGDTIQLSSI